jgi:hypothetical protein
VSETWVAVSGSPHLCDWGTSRAGRQYTGVTFKWFANNWGRVTYQLWRVHHSLSATGRVSTSRCGASHWSFRFHSPPFTPILGIWSWHLRDHETAGFNSVHFLERCSGHIFGNMAIFVTEDDKIVPKDADKLLEKRLTMRPDEKIQCVFTNCSDAATMRVRVRNHGRYCGGNGERITQKELPPRPTGVENKDRSRS